MSVNRFVGWRGRGYKTMHGGVYIENAGGTGSSSGFLHCVKAASLRKCSVEAGLACWTSMYVRVRLAQAWPGNEAMAKVNCIYSIQSSSCI